MNLWMPLQKRELTALMYTGIDCVLYLNPSIRKRYPLYFLKQYSALTPKAPDY